MANILHSANAASPLPTNEYAIADAVRLLSQNGDYVVHRDGWMFQVMSWLAAHIQRPNALIALPQPGHAEKGLDGLEILLDSAGSVVATIIFEDKATENPRKTIREKVWPEFAEFENGKDISRMTQQAASILAISRHPSPSEAAARIVWNTSRRYRVSITADTSTTTSRSSLFKDYETTVPGAVDRRRAEVFEVVNMRDWMAKLATKSIAKAHAMSQK
ncbi:hypothetical protein [uncultured Comamonas sp.]|uniref:hypothetical protein n=1 Tax=uncultured Comamonas sp. TaxID=114710 RepID=UPI0025EC7510|nr:hypothetical protein [uncultured Comamonas sp.]